MLVLGDQKSDKETLIQYMIQVRFIFCDSSIQGLLRNLSVPGRVRVRLANWWQDNTRLLSCKSTKSNKYRQTRLNPRKTSPRLLSVESAASFYFLTRVHSSKSNSSKLGIKQCKKRQLCRKQSVSFLETILSQKQQKFSWWIKSKNK
jgi:hypothetical protein